MINQTLLEVSFAAGLGGRQKVEQVRVARRLLSQIGVLIGQRGWSYVP
jgi:hypothetical protein